MNNLDYSGVSGKVINFSTSKKCFLELRNTESNEIRKMILAPTGKFSFDRIKPGKYSLFAYYDENSDGRWNEGFPYPFKPSEPFYLMKEAINVPARWSVIDVVVDLKEIK
jgi:uncharacterized protein (DUF2141 family)